MVDTVPPWLEIMRALEGTAWSPSDPINQLIVGWVREIGATYEDMAQYCNGVGGQYFSWCGAGVAHCMHKSGIRPVFGATDVKRFLWAQAWLVDWGTPVTVPQPGDVLVFDFGGGDHHVTLFDHDNGDGSWACMGANQSHQVKLSNYRKSQCMGIRRPSVAGAIAPSAQAVAADRPLLKGGDVNPAVGELQALLRISVDSEFGPDTAAAVRAYQAAHGLEVDGEVGPLTWAVLLGGPVPLKGATSSGLSADLIQKIASLAAASDLARYSWNDDRGRAPIGYIKGLAVVFARLLLKLKAGDSAARLMASLPTGDTDHDALAWYGVTNITAGSSTLRALFSLLYGLGMRESSGQYGEGRDTSAQNVESDTAEAGLFQQSWNSHVASAEIGRLMATYQAKPDGLIEIFREGVSAGVSGSVGGGDGLAFQRLCKTCPAFAVEAAAVGLRVLRHHWGPINRRKAEIRPEADALLQQVQAIVDAIPLEKPMPDTIDQPSTGQMPSTQVLDADPLQGIIRAAIAGAAQGAGQYVHDHPTVVGGIVLAFVTRLTTPAAQPPVAGQTQAPSSPAAPTATTGGLSSVLSTALKFVGGIPGLGVWGGILTVAGQLIAAKAGVAELPLTPEQGMTGLITTLTGGTSLLGGLVGMLTNLTKASQPKAPTA